MSHSEEVVGIKNSAVDPLKNCVVVLIPKKPLPTNPFVGAAVPAKVPKAADPLQSRVFAPRKLFVFPNVKEGIEEEAGVLVAFVILGILGTSSYHVS